MRTNASEFRDVVWCANGEVKLEANERSRNVNFTRDFEIIAAAYLLARPTYDGFPRSSATPSLEVIGEARAHASTADAARDLI